MLKLSEAKNVQNRTLTVPAATQVKTTGAE
jgi:hypothetical protein